MEFSRVLFRSEHLQRRAEQPTDHVVLVRVAQHLKQGEQGRLELGHRVIPSLRVLGRSRRASRGGPTTCVTDTTCLDPKSSEESSVGKEWESQGRSVWSWYEYKIKNNNNT